MWREWKRGPVPGPVHSVCRSRSFVGLTAIAEALCRWGCGTPEACTIAACIDLGELLSGQAAGPQSALLGLAPR